MTGYIPSQGCFKDMVESDAFSTVVFTKDPAPLWPVLADGTGLMLDALVLIPALWKNRSGLFTTTFALLAKNHPVP